MCETQSFEQAVVVEELGLQLRRAKLRLDIAGLFGFVSIDWVYAFLLEDLEDLIWEHGCLSGEPSQAMANRSQIMISAVERFLK